jgi:hypothetical protein
MSEDNDNATEGMTFDRYQACVNMTRIFHGIIAATTAGEAYQTQATGLFHDLLDPDDMLEGLMSNAAHATSEALDAIDTLAEQLNISQFPAELSPKDYCAARGYSDELVRLFEEGKPTDED